jgi:succinyl-diaminopimelate desuccinylase
VKTPFCINPNTPVIRTLIDTYNEVTGQNKEPFTMGGGTYACHFAHAVSFGLEEPDAVAPEWVGTMHGANEGVRIELLFTALKIYILAIARLMELDF